MFATSPVRVVRSVLRAREHQATFWAELNHESPSLMRLDEIGSAIQRHMADANAGFEKMLHLNPNSVSALRDYAEFLSQVPRTVPFPSESMAAFHGFPSESRVSPLPAAEIDSADDVRVASSIPHWQVMNNSARAEQLTQQADDIEETMAKEFAEKSSNVVMFQQGTALDASREDLGLITVTQSLSNLGAIENANLVALTMFGYTKRDLIGKNINSIVPFPMANVHNEYILRFVSTGTSVRIPVMGCCCCCCCFGVTGICRIFVVAGSCQRL